MASPLQAILLGLLQGITEFLPVSSSGHLALAQHYLRMEEGGLTLSVVLHGGTLLATVLLLRQRVYAAAADSFKAVLEPSRFRTTSGGRDALTVILAMIPTGVIGLLLHDTVEHLTSSPAAVGIGLLLTTGLLLSTRALRGGELDVPPWWGALLVGLAQGAAVFPGISRSGSTICVALWLGIKPGRAFELSMLMSLPAVAGAVVLEARRLDLSSAALVTPLVGALVALISGAVAMSLLRGVVVHGRLPWFAAWTGLAALLALSLTVR